MLEICSNKKTNMFIIDVPVLATHDHSAANVGTESYFLCFIIMFGADSYTKFSSHSLTSLKILHQKVSNRKFISVPT